MISRGTNKSEVQRCWNKRLPNLFKKSCQKESTAVFALKLMFSKKLKKSVNIGPTFVAKFDDKHYQKSGHGA